MHKIIFTYSLPYVLLNTKEQSLIKQPTLKYPLATDVNVSVTLLQRKGVLNNEEFWQCFRGKAVLKQSSKKLI